ncbi:MAG: methyl-accepting chemotaxis protein [Desulfobacterales bacterium]|nr:methyl-accepting chemotaxis protein [Desulfobacterales bacterium]
MQAETGCKKSNDEVKGRIFLDLYEQSMSSMVGFLLLFWALVFLTPILKEHRNITLSFIVTVTLLCGIRIFAIKKAPKVYWNNPLFWNRTFVVTSLLSSVLWVMVAGFVVHTYGVTSIYSLYAMLITCGLVSGSVVSLSPLYSMFVGYVSTTLVPLGICFLSKGEWGLGSIFVIFNVVMICLGKKASKAYQASKQTMVMLDERTRAIEFLMKDVTGKAETLTEMSKGLNRISGEMVDASEGTVAEIEGVATDTSAMRENAVAISVALEQASRNMEITYTSMEEISGAVSEIAEQSAKALDITAQGVKQADEATDKIRDLDEAAQEIGKITEVITDISEQTNLLALNATIEAARAGEAGKGFAVVASEIKALARQTAEATGSIRNRVEGIQSATSDSTDQIREISQVISDIDGIVNAVATAIEEQTATTKEIDRNVGEMNTGMGEITLQTTEANHGIETIFGRIESASNQTHTNLDNSRRVMESAQDVLGLADELNEAVSRLAVGQ